jgi:dihydropyrimidinase
MSILIQNGVLVLPDGPPRADLRVDGDKIVQSAPPCPRGTAGCWTPPGSWCFPA